MTEDKLKDTRQLSIIYEGECEQCDYIGPMNSEESQLICPSCQHKIDRNTVKQTGSIPTRHLGDNNSLNGVADLFETRAEVARELYEDGWKKDSSRDSPNCLRVVPSSDSSGTTEQSNDEVGERQSIDSELWDTSERDSTSDGIGLVDYVSECPICRADILVRHDDWDLDGKIVSQEEVFCHSCETAVPKHVTAITFTSYPKEYFRHTSDLRSAAFKLKGMSEWLRGLQQEGWYLESTRDQYLRVRHDIESTDDIEVNSEGHLKELQNT